MPISKKKIIYNFWNVPVIFQLGNLDHFTRIWRHKDVTEEILKYIIDEYGANFI